MSFSELDVYTQRLCGKSDKRISQWSRDIHVPGRKDVSHAGNG